MDRAEPSVSELRESGRDCYQRRQWVAAFAALSQADHIEPLAAADLWLLAWSAHLSGRDPDFAQAMGRAYRANLDAGEPLTAARCAGWLGAILDVGGEVGPGAGWLSRAQRLIEREGIDCPERGFLVLLAAFDHAESGDHDAMLAAATQAFEIAERFGDADLAAMALILQGRARLARGETKAGLALLDEAMVSVTTDQLLPALTGLAYCNVIEGCQQVYDLRRSQEWTAALTRWCDGQPELVPYAGQCLVHRSEISQLRGDWVAALEEAMRASERLAGRPAIGNAYYQLAEIHRLRGEFREAEQAYRRVGEFGRQPQPGLALLRLAESRVNVAAAAIARVLDESSDRASRCRVLPAYVDIMLAAHQVSAAQTAADELYTIAEMLEAPLLRAAAAHARGAVTLAAGDPAGALVELRRAVSIWGQMEAPYESARVRVLVGQACRALGDADGAEIEFDAADQVFQQVGAASDLDRLRKLISSAGLSYPNGLTAREVQVLSLVATGQTNREISSKLMISEHTVARHLQNLFGKLGVSSRTAATAYALEHSLI
ncbi:MAG TPA: LuxR C-terminal-related transcriptional regulator [Propionibacteriaceae bacterium]|nr:LuxR C-terminal-related transcriptional regulator [Propionibacteriaceae bacterium]